MQNCPYCQKEIALNALSCPFCGMRITSQDPGTLPSYSPSPIQNWKRTVKVAALVALVATSSLVFSYFLVPGVSQFFQDIGLVPKASSCSIPGPGCPAAFHAAPRVNYDQQIVMSLHQDLTSLSFNVTAVEQTDRNGYGPVYLVNAQSDKLYWYQIGISLNWPDSRGGYYQGWHFGTETFTISGATSPPLVGGPVANINPGDTVSLKIYLSNGNVIMSAHDFQTGDGLNQTVYALGASKFQYGAKYITGLMTEWYHVEPAPDETAMQRVTYTDVGLPMYSASICMDDFAVNGTMVVFGGCSGTLTLNQDFQSFSSHGLNAYANESQFMTGPS